MSYPESDEYKLAIKNIINIIINIINIINIFNQSTNQLIIPATILPERKHKGTPPPGLVLPPTKYKLS
jgi:hypothetical protein